MKRKNSNFIMSHESSSTSKCEILKASEVKKTIKLSTGSLKLDEYFSGGLPVKGLIELCGESGSGKSQFCMQLALSVQLPEESGGLGGGAIYICSEEPFQSKRLYQMIEKIKSKIQKKIEFSNNIFVLHLADYGSLESSFKKISQLIQDRNIKLLVLDSITALFRGNFCDGGGRKKASDLRAIARNFYNLHGKYGIMIVCVNQVTESLSGDKGSVPALGLAWANLVTTRIQLKRSQKRRTLIVVFSPEISQQEIQFEITESGVDAKLAKLFPKCKIKVEKKADSLYPIVGAASICAKVLRDTVVRNWKFPELINITDRDFGTGYPGDPKSKQFLMENKDDVFGFPNFVRFSWSTADKLLENVTQVEWDDESDVNDSKSENISRYFCDISTSGDVKHKTKGTFFKERSLSSVEKF